MRIAFPTQQDLGLESTVFNHFGSATRFVLVDTETGEVSAIENADRNHIHGQCSPLKALDGVSVDMVVVGGIGGGALKKLQHAGIQVFCAIPGTVSENLERAKAGTLTEMSLLSVCSGHDHDGGCAH